MTLVHTGGWLNRIDPGALGQPPKAANYSTDLGSQKARLEGALPRGYGLNWEVQNASAVAAPSTIAIPTRKIMSCT